MNRKQGHLATHPDSELARQLKAATESDGRLDVDTGEVLYHLTVKQVQQADRYAPVPDEQSAPPHQDVVGQSVRRAAAAVIRAIRDSVPVAAQSSADLIAEMREEQRHRHGV